MFKWLKSLFRRPPDYCSSVPYADVGRPDAEPDQKPLYWHDLYSLRVHATGMQHPRMPREIKAGDIIGPEKSEYAWTVHGGPISIHLDSGSVTLRNIIFFGPLITIQGMGRVIFEDCIFLDGTGVDQAMVPAAGTIDLRGGFLMLRRCIFADNHGAYGGAIQTHSGSQLRATHCLFLNNRAENDGGAVAIEGTSKADFFYCSFIGNVAAQGSAIACHGTIYDVGSAQLERCVVIEENNKEHRFLDDNQDPWGPWHHSEKPNRISAKSCLLPSSNKKALWTDNIYRTPKHDEWKDWPYAVAPEDLADLADEASNPDDFIGNWFGYELNKQAGAASNKRWGM